jgi:NAD-dependent dihydropyrimidine dehydrogenase PreA subunit
MAIERIDSEKCIGCGTCVLSCPADVIRLNGETNKAYPKYPLDCVTCCWCLAECPQHAIFHSPSNVSQVFTSWG